MNAIRSSLPELTADLASIVGPTVSRNRPRDITCLAANSESNNNSEASIQIISFNDVSPEIACRWESLRAADPSLKSPYFDFEFTRAVAAVRDDVRIAILARNGQIESLFPFQSKGAHQIGPIGGMLNDVHGVIGNSQSPSELLNRLVSLDNNWSMPFHAFKNPDSQLEKFRFRALESYYLDLSAGWDAYRKWIKCNSSTIARHGQKSRGLEREIGPLRFEFDVREPELLERLIALKRSKYQRSKTFDILSVDWAGDLLREIFSIQKPNFRGLLSALWAGDQLVGIHFGMITSDMVHYWFPVYDPQFSRFSPGTELLLRVAEEASRRGLTKVDLGFGDDPYKFKFANGRESLCCGRLTTSALTFQVAKQRYLMRQKLKQIPMKTTAKKILRRWFPGFGGWNFK